MGTSRVLSMNWSWYKGLTALNRMVIHFYMYGRAPTLPGQDGCTVLFGAILGYTEVWPVFKTDVGLNYCVMDLGSLGRTYIFFLARFLCKLSISLCPAYRPSWTLNVLFP